MEFSLIILFVSYTHPESMKRFVTHIMKFSWESLADFQSGLRKNQGRMTVLRFCGEEEVVWDQHSITCKFILYGLDFPLMPKESTLRLSYQLSQIKYSREGGVIGLKPVKSLTSKMESNYYN